MANEQINIQTLSKEYGNSIVQALAIAQKIKAISGPKDLEQLIVAGIETALEDFKEKLEAAATTKIEL